MINVANLVQLKAFRTPRCLAARTVVGSSFACIMLLNAGFIGNILALATPFLVGYRLKAFRTEALFGVISFRRAYADRSTRSSTLRWCSHRAVRLLPVGIRRVRQSYHHNDEAAGADLNEQQGISKTEIKNSMDVTMITPVHWRSCS